MSSAPAFAPRLDAFLRDALPDLVGPMAIARVAGGQSNPTFFVDYGDRRLVLRKQPPGAVLPSAHAVDREFRILAALERTDVPVPGVLLFYDDRDVVGTPFYVMERVEGRVFHDCALPGLAAAERRAAYLAMATTLGRLHAVDWAAVGLTDYGRHESYFARQVARWTKQWELSKTRELPDIDRLIGWLPAHLPADDRTTIVHGDFRLGNLMFRPDAPQVAAVLDWELSTLGHPLADLAHSCIGWHTTPAEFLGVRGLDLAALGIPSEADYCAAYYAACGHDARLSAFHLVFALFRFAVILEGVAARAQQGNAAADDAREVGQLSAAFARHAVELIDTPL